MTYTIISIIIVVIILFIIIYINYDYSHKYKKSEKDLYYEAVDLLQEGKHREAYTTLLALIKNDTTNVKAYLKLGEVLRSIGKPAKALKVHKSLLIRKDMTNYESIELYKNISLDYKSLNKIDESIVECKKILKIEKNNEWALLELINLYKTIDDWNSSKKYLHTYQKITGNMDSRILGLYLVKQGIIELEKKEFIESRSLFEEGMNMDSNLAVCYKLMGDSYSQESEIEYQKYKENDNEEIYERAKELLSKALSMWVKYAQNKPRCSYDVLHLIKDSLFFLERYSELEYILKDLVERDSDNIDALINLADYYSNEGQNEKSISLLDSLNEKDKQSFYARMVRMKLRLNITDGISEEIIKEFEDMTKQLTKSDHLSFSDSIDEDLKWLQETDEIKN